MSLLAAPLEQSEVDEIKAKFPDFDGELPTEARYWSLGDLELFFGSNGQLRPRETADTAAPTSSLLSRLRQSLAEDGVDEATAEYRSFCRHLREHGEVQRLPTVAECNEVPRVDRVPRLLKAPMLVHCPKDWKGRQWNMEFWRREYGDQAWKFRARSPVFESDRKGADLASVEGTVAEYIDYVRVIQKMDPHCKEDNSVAFPRVGFDNWCPFLAAARPIFDSCWRDLRPAGVHDLSVRWMKLFCATFNMDWTEFVARYFKVTISAPGSISRLHTENHRAHTWFTQIEGRRMFFIFPPTEARCLYEESGGSCGGPEGSAHAVSPVDIFFPSQKRHPRLSETKPKVAVLAPGETLILPSGYWRYSVALEPSVTMHHPFWNLENRTHLVPELKEAFEEDKMPPEMKELAARHFAVIHEHIVDDIDSDMEDN